jgi:hypothetical protein
MAEVRAPGVIASYMAGRRSSWTAAVSPRSLAFSPPSPLPLDTQHSALRGRPLHLPSSKRALARLCGSWHGVVRRLEDVACRGASYESVDLGGGDLHVAWAHAARKDSDAQDACSARRMTPAPRAVSATHDHAQV